MGNYRHTDDTDPWKYSVRELMEQNKPRPVGRPRGPSEPVRLPPGPVGPPPPPECWPAVGAATAYGYHRISFKGTWWDCRHLCRPVNGLWLIAASGRPLADTLDRFPRDAEPAASQDAPAPAWAQVAYRQPIAPPRALEPAPKGAPAQEAAPLPPILPPFPVQRILNKG